MERQHGSFHRTTVQSVTLGQESLQATTLAGSKRLHSDTAADPYLPEPNKQVQLQKASGAAKEFPKLKASDIVSLHTSSAALPSEYSQRKVVSATPTSTVDRSLSLSFSRYALPEALVSNFHALGIKEIYPWQKQCLLGPGLLDGARNLVYSAPTGGGKSFVADILMLKRVLEDRNAKALLVLPYVALVQEKIRWPRNIVQGIKKKPVNSDDDKGKTRLWQRRPDEDNVRVVGFFGGGKIRAAWPDFDIGVCTFEKVRLLCSCCSCVPLVAQI